MGRNNRLSFSETRVPCSLISFERQPVVFRHLALRLVRLLPLLPTTSPSILWKKLSSSSYAGLRQRGLRIQTPAGCVSSPRPSSRAPPPFPDVAELAERNWLDDSDSNGEGEADLPRDSSIGCCGPMAWILKVT